MGSGEGIVGDRPACGVWGTGDDGSIGEVPDGVDPAASGLLTCVFITLS